MSKSKHDIIKIGTTIDVEESSDVTIDIARLVASRMLITASSGGGKSYLLRRVLEEASATTQTIVLDAEGEFATLRESRDMVLCGPNGEAPVEPRSASLLCRRLMELNLSAVIDVSELARHEKRTFLATFINTMVDLPRSLWRPCIVAVDETHEFAEEGNKSESGKALALLASKGRKRGYCLLGATQRLSKLDKDVAAELKNVFIGQMTLDVDLKRAADMLGFAKDRWPSIRDLSPPKHEGQFYGFGPALNHRGVAKFRGAEVTTTHPRAGQGRLAQPPAPSAKIRGVLDELKDIPQQAEAEIRDLATAKSEIFNLQKQVKQLQRSPEVRAAAKGHTESQSIAAVRNEAKAQQRRDAQTIARLRKGLEEAMKVIAEINAKGFEAAGINPDVVKKALESAGELILKSAQQSIDRRQAEFERLKAAMTKSLSQMQKLLADADVQVSVDVKHNEPFTVTKPAPARPIEARPAVAHEGVTQAQQKILDSLAWWDVIGSAVVEKQAVAVMAGYTVNGHFTNVLGSLRSAGLVDYPQGGKVMLTEAGRDLANFPGSPGSLEDVHAAWKAKLNSAQWKIVEQIIAAHPTVFTSKEELAERSGYTVNGHFTNVLGSLRSLGAISKRGDIGATDLLFPASLV